ncbi:alginate O-acetyltransferase [Gynuella sp.]|uniref:alginate O-acetyltransferase n=1 Tax=Gynuella sp. TaxID=2969146 RepID=UPI003D0EFFEF
MVTTLQRLGVIGFLLVMSGLGIWSVSKMTVIATPGSGRFVDGQWRQQFEDQYTETFPVRPFATSLWAAIQYTLFSEGRQGVVVGSSDWLFSQEEFSAYADFDHRLQQQYQRIIAVRDHFRANDIDLAILIIPAKARVYSEYLGKHKPSDQQQALYPQVHEFLAAQSIVAPELLSVFIQQKVSQQLFFKTDTHWTPAGADLAATFMATTAAKRFPDIQSGSQQFQTEFKELLEHRGDLLNFIPLSPYFTALGPDPELLQQQQTVALTSDIGLFSDQRVEVALVGTSYSANELWNFAGYLKQHLGVDLVNYAEEGHGPMLPMINYLQSDDFMDAPPRLVIWEFPERYLSMPDDLSGHRLPFLMTTGE